MTQALVTYQREPAPLVPAVAERLIYLSGKAEEYDARKRAESTNKTYEKERRAFQAWCEAHSLPYFPAPHEVVRLYVVECAERRRPRGISVACAAIRAAHFDAGLFDPTSHPDVKNALRGIQNVHGIAPKKKRALAMAQIRAICAAIPDDMPGIRDRAIVLLGFAGAFRRAPLSAMFIEHIEDHDAGLQVFISRDKTDQKARGRTIVVPFGDHPETCPVVAVKAWMAIVGRSTGPLFVGFRSGRRTTKPIRLRSTALSSGVVAEIVKSRCEAAGIDPAAFSGHSLRRGFATAAALAGKPLDRIKAQGGWTKTDTVMGYIDEALAGNEDNAARGIGL